MKLFYATGNESKIKNMRYRLSGYEVELVTPKDLGIHIRVEETGATPTENARLKARAYFEQTGLPTLAADSGLYIDGIPEELQPGLHVRRVNGRTLSEDEMISRYSSLAAEYGGILRARYMTGLVMICRGREYTAEIPDDDVLITGEPNSNRRHRGNPLDVVTVCPANGKYFNDCSLEELSVLAGSFDRKCIRFLQESGIIPEKSCGGIVCTIRNGRIEYLLIEESGGFHSFPKGHMETGESERETAIREIREETGLKLDLIEGFREVDEYIPAENAGVCRQVVYFLAEYSEQLRGSRSRRKSDRSRAWIWRLRWLCSNMRGLGGSCLRQTGISGESASLSCRMMRHGTGTSSGSVPGSKAPWRDLPSESNMSAAPPCRDCPPNRSSISMWS